MKIPISEYVCMQFISDNRLVSSPTFTFLVGDDGKALSLPAKLVAAQSKPFEKLVTGPMSEARNLTAEMRNVDEATFLKFCEFVFEGDFAPKFPVAERQSPYPRYPGRAGEILHHANNVRSVWNRTPQQGQLRYPGRRSVDVKPTTEDDSNARKTKVVHLNFERTEYEIPDDFWSTQTSDSPDSMGEIQYLPLLISLARIYFFADQWGVEDLSRAALSKLHAALNHGFPAGASHCLELLELALFIYDNTPPSTEDINELRAVVANFIARNIRNLSETDDFYEALKRNGELMQDVLTVVVKCELREY